MTDKDIQAFDELESALKSIVPDALKTGGGVAMRRFKSLGLKYQRMGAEKGETRYTFLGNWVLMSLKAHTDAAVSSMRGEGPTPETRAKIALDPVLWLAENGLINADQENALEILGVVWAAFGKGMGGQPATMDGLRVDGHGEYRDPTDRMREDVAQVISAVFTPWAKEMGRRTKKATEPNLVKITGSRYLPITRYNLIWYVVVDRVPIHQIAKFLHCHPADIGVTIKQALNRFLDLYEKAQCIDEVPRMSRLLKDPLVNTSEERGE